MFYRNTKMAERFAASQAATYNPGRIPQRKLGFIRYQPSDFDSTAEFVWFYANYFITTLGILFSVVLIIMIIALYAAHPWNEDATVDSLDDYDAYPPRPSMKPLAWCLTPDLVILLWLCIEGSQNSRYVPPISTHIRLAIESIIFAGTVACMVLFGLFMATPASHNDYYDGWYRGLLAVLALLAFTRFARLIIEVCELLWAPSKDSKRSSQNNGAAAQNGNVDVAQV